MYNYSLVIFTAAIYNMSELFSTLMFKVRIS